MNSFGNILFALVLFFNTAHDNHGTLMVFEFDAESKSFNNIYLEVDAFHFEETLNEFHQSNLQLGENKALEKDLINDYIQNEMSLNVNGKTQKLSVKSFEVDYLFCIIKFEDIKGLRKIKKIEMDNDFMLEHFPGQKNLVNFYIKDEQVSFLFDEVNTQESFKF